MLSTPASVIAQALDTAEQTGNPIAPLSSTHNDLQVADAYAVQRAWLEAKRSRGEQLTGRKIGLTSKAMQTQLGVDQPDYGFLLQSMVVPSGSTLSRSDLILPRVEPEIAFWLSKDLRGPGMTREQVFAATRGVCPSLEVVDSRIADWKIKLVDTIADNGSSARAVVADPVLPLDGLDLADIEVVLRRNGEEVGRGTGAAVLGHPADAVAWLANALAEYGDGLEAGQLILPGAMCASVFGNAGDQFVAEFSGLGSVEVRFA